jgi:hypothetical protein
VSKTDIGVFFSGIAAGCIAVAVTVFAVFFYVQFRKIIRERKRK